MRKLPPRLPSQARRSRPNDATRRSGHRSALDFAVSAASNCSTASTPLITSTFREGIRSPRGSHGATSAPTRDRTTWCRVEQQLRRQAPCCQQQGPRVHRSVRFHIEVSGRLQRAGDRRDAAVVAQARAARLDRDRRSHHMDARRHVRRPPSSRDGRRSIGGYPLPRQSTDRRSVPMEPAFDSSSTTRVGFSRSPTARARSDGSSSRTTQAADSYRWIVLRVPRSGTRT